MKVAIIGAGISGLCCACELEKHGITPVIYERNNFIGEAYSHVSVVLNITHRPIKDMPTFIYRKFGVQITPINTINTIVHNSPNKKDIIKGNLGYMFKYSKDKDSVRNQIHSKLKNTQIIFNEQRNHNVLSKKFDNVVVATGRNYTAEEMGVWRSWFDAYIKGAVIVGNFDPNRVEMWVNKDYCKNGYAYLVPFSARKASIILVVNDISVKEVDYYWELFLYSENIKYEIIEEFKLHHVAGYVYPKTVENIIFAGNAGGGIDPFLGFALLNAVAMGVSSARTIAKGIDYEAQIKDLMNMNLQMWELRKNFNKLSNKDYDNLISIISMPGIKQLMYNTPVNIRKIAAIASKITKAK